MIEGQKLRLERVSKNHTVGRTDFPGARSLDGSAFYLHLDDALLIGVGSRAVGVDMTVKCDAWAESIAGCGFRRDDLGEY